MKDNNIRQIIKIGEKFNKLTAIKFDHKEDGCPQYWLFECDCGNKKAIKVNAVKSGHTKSCGCLNKTSWNKGKSSWNKGLKMSDKTKKKISEAHKGKKLSDETKAKMSKAGIGRKHTTEHRMKNSKSHEGINTWMKNRKVSNETREKMSNSKRGGLHPNWKGGITSENKKIRNGKEIQVWRDNIFKRDKYICQMPGCDKVGKYLEAHHIKKFADFQELRFDVNNGITLCKKCHNKTKWKEEQYEVLLTNIINLKQ